MSEKLLQSPTSYSSLLQCACENGKLKCKREITETTGSSASNTNLIADNTSLYMVAYNQLIQSDGDSFTLDLQIFRFVSSL